MIVVQAKKMRKTARVLGILDEKYLCRIERLARIRHGSFGSVDIPGRDSADTSDRSRRHRQEESSVVVGSVD